MRKLEVWEIEKIQYLISHKGLSAAELVVEIYDHYCSHLESVGPENSQGELALLEEKFTQSYCKKLEQDLMGASRKEVFRLALKEMKSFFTWPRTLGTFAFFMIVFFFWSFLDVKQKLQMFFIIFVAVFLTISWMWVQSHQKVKIVKAFYKGDKILVSAYLSSIMSHYSLTLGLFSFLVTTPKILDLYNIIETPYFPFISLVLFCFYSLFILAMLNVWKIKSKTALV